MSKKVSRNIILHLNRFQERILYPVMISCLIACICIVLCLAYIYYPADHMVLFNLTLLDFKVYIPRILGLLGVILMSTVFWTYWMSNKLVGPYERIVKNLDEIIEGNAKGPIATRKGDEMFEELLKRINHIVTPPSDSSK